MIWLAANQRQIKQKPRADRTTTATPRPATPSNLNAAASEFVPKVVDTENG